MATALRERLQQRGGLRVAIVCAVILGNAGFLWFYVKSNERRRSELGILAAQMATWPKKPLTLGDPGASNKARDAALTLSSALGRATFNTARCRVVTTNSPAEVLGYLEVALDESGVVRAVTAEGPAATAEAAACLRNLLLGRIPTNPHKLNAERIAGPVDVRLGLLPYRTIFE